MGNIIVKFLEYASSNEVTVDYVDEKDYDTVYNMITTFGTNGIPKIGIYKNNKIIGAILLDKDYLPWEYRFDVIIKRGYRKRGYLKLLMDKLIEDFNNDPQADQLSAQVLSSKFSEILEDRYGFSVGDYEDMDFVWISKNSN